jgi:hypothetical protein
MPTMKDYIEDARREIGRTRSDLQSDTDYYEAEALVRRRGFAIPEELQSVKAAVGWARLYIDALVARLKIEGFSRPGSTDADEEFQRWWRVNNLDEEFSISALETLIHGRSFVSVSAPTPEDIKYGHPSDVPIICIESAHHMWVDIDPRTKRVRWAVRFYNSPTHLDSASDEQMYTVYLPDSTTVLQDDGRGNLSIIEQNAHNLGIVNIVPSLNRERISDRFGKSEIMPELRSVQDIATRILINMQAAADLMAVPQRLLFGVEKNAIIQNDTPEARYEAYMAGILAFENSDGKASQFTAAELSNYTVALQELAKNVASYTGLPPQYLSFSSDNPASAEAIRSAESRLVKTCEMKGSMLGNVWEKVMRLGKLVMGQKLTADDALVEAMLADPATPTFAAKADAVMKLVAGKPVIPIEQARIEMGFSPEARENMKVMDEQEADELAAAMNGVPSARFALPTPQNESETDDSTPERRERPEAD